MACCVGDIQRPQMTRSYAECQNVINILCSIYSFPINLLNSTFSCLVLFPKYSEILVKNHKRRNVSDSIGRCLKTRIGFQFKTKRWTRYVRS